MTSKAQPVARKRSGANLRLRISDVSKMLNVSSSTLRQWENAGLTSPSRTQSGYRTYSYADIEKLKQVQKLRIEMNLNIDAILHLLTRRKNYRPKVADSKTSIADIGNQLRRLRRARKLTLSQAAAGARLSVSFLSGLERGQVHASIATLQRLSVFYDTNILSFFGPMKTAVKLVRPEQRKEISNEPGVHMQLLTSGRTQMEPHLFRLDPGASSGGAYHHEGEEFIFVISGTCEIWLDEVEHYRLSAGDSLYFSSSQTHRWSNTGSEQAILLWINTPPTF